MTLFENNVYTRPVCWTSASGGSMGDISYICRKQSHSSTKKMKENVSISRIHTHVNVHVLLYGSGSRNIAVTKTGSCFLRVLVKNNESPENIVLTMK